MKNSSNKNKRLQLPKKTIGVNDIVLILLQITQNNLIHGKIDTWSNFLFLDKIEQIAYMNLSVLITW